MKSYTSRLILHTVVSVLAGAAAIGQTASAQTFDSSGNALLQGRFLLWEHQIVTDPDTPVAVTQVTQYGEIVFNGAGAYTMTTTLIDSGDEPVEAVVRTGTYAISGSGFGFLDRDDADGGSIYGSVANGVFIGSSTESSVNNLFVAAKPAATPPTAANLTGTYSVAYFSTATGNLRQSRTASYRLAPNGAGGLADINATGSIAGSLNQVNQTVVAATYSIVDGSGEIALGALPNDNQFLGGTQRFYLSAGRELIFGGSLSGGDMFVGVKNPAAAVSPNLLSGLFFTAGVEIDRAEIVGGPPRVVSNYGSSTFNGGVERGHQRIRTALDPVSYDFNYSDFYVLAPTGANSSFLGYLHQLDETGKFRVGIGQNDLLGIYVGLAAPTYTPKPDVFVNPIGVVNAASFAPPTAGISPGSMLTIFGSGFALDNFSDTTFPTILGGVQVRVNGVLAPVFQVIGKSALNQLSFIVPYGIGTPQNPVVEIVVYRDGRPSNRFTGLLNRISPGIFTVPAGGVGYAAALHTDFSLVEPSHPALPGEVILVYMNGLGQVDPQVAAGTPGPVDPLSETVEDLRVFIGGTLAQIGYSGLAPFLPGLYQMNLTVPADALPGDTFLELDGFDHFNSMVMIPIGAAPNAAATARSAEQEAPQRLLRRPSR